jgi:hypothetical protein
MRVPQVTERIKEAPVQALRGVLSGIGQVLLFTDKLRNKNATPADAPDATATKSASDSAAPATDSASAEAATAAEASVTAEAEAVLASAPAEAVPVADAEAAPAAKAAAPAKTRKPRKPRDLNKTGNVRIITEEDAAPAPAEVAAEVEVATAEVEVVVVEVPAEAEVPAEPEISAEAEAPAAGELPMPTYDDLSVASIRARMRNLTAAQIATLADYEKAHAARPEVVTMFERRIAKLEAEG